MLMSDNEDQLVPHCLKKKKVMLNRRHSVTGQHLAGCASKLVKEKEILLFNPDSMFVHLPISAVLLR